MKPSIPTIVVAAFVICQMAFSQSPIPDVFTGASGHPLGNAKVIRFDGNNFIVEHDGGISTIPWDRAPKSVQAQNPRNARGNVVPGAPKPAATKDPFVKLSFPDGGRSFTIVRGQPVVTRARVDDPSLVSEFSFRTDSETLPTFVPPGTSEADRKTHRYAYWFPNRVDDYVVQPVVVPVPDVSVNKIAPLTVHVKEPTPDPALPPIQGKVHAIGPTEMSLEWPAKFTSQPGSVVIVERRKANQTGWTQMGPFDISNSQVGGPNAEGEECRFAIAGGMQPSTDYFFRFSYITSDGRISASGPNRPKTDPRSLATATDVTYTLLPRDVELALAKHLADLGRGPLEPATGTAVAKQETAVLGPARAVALNRKGQVVIEQVMNGSKGFWFWDAVSGLKEIPGGLLRRGTFLVTGLGDDGIVHGFWKTGEKGPNNSRPLPRFALWDSATGVTKDLEK